MTTTFQKIEPVSKKQRVMATLKEAILSGVLKSGDPIVEGKIAQQFGVGQGLIREALIELEHHGFVERTPFSGTRVVQLSSEDMQQIFDLRIALDPLAVYLAGPAVRGAALDDLERLATKAKRAADGHNLAAFFESHLAFRRRIWELSGNKYVQQALERSVVPLYALYLIRSSSNREGILATVTDCVQHQDQILAAYRSGNFDQARQVAHDFLVRMKTYMKAHFSV